MTPDGKE